jgi:hypothetical protein
MNLARSLSLYRLSYPRRKYIFSCFLFRTDDTQKRAPTDAMKFTPDSCFSMNLAVNPEIFALFRLGTFEEGFKQRILLVHRIFVPEIDFMHKIKL